MSSKRWIRLKEHSPNTDREITPAEQFIEFSDSTLGPGPFRLRTDNEGYIQTGNLPNTKAESLVVLGGSFVESTFTAESDRFLSRAERLMPQYRILNGGYSGTTTLQLLNTMINKVYPSIGADGKLIMFIGQSDADVIDLDGSYWTNVERWTPIIPGSPLSHHLPTRGPSVEAVIRIIIEAAKALRIDLTLAVSPFRINNFSHDMVLRKRFRRNRELFNRKMEIREEIRLTAVRVAEEQGVPCIDFVGLIGSNPEWFYDTLHLNDLGQQNFANLFVDEIQKLDNIKIN